MDEPVGLVSEQKELKMPVPMLLPQSLNLSPNINAKSF
jgi:hypothetical protein